jgi:hypothetical protein
MWLHPDCRLGRLDCCWALVHSSSKQTLRGARRIFVKKTLCGARRILVPFAVCTVTRLAVMVLMTPLFAWFLLGFRICTLSPIAKGLTDTVSVSVGILVARVDAVAPVLVPLSALRRAISACCRSCNRWSCSTMSLMSSSHMNKELLDNNVVISTISHAPIDFNWKVVLGRRLVR